MRAAWLVSTTRRPSWSARFAFDDAIAVAERVLMHSQQLSDADLVENATQDHLLAIAQHLKIDERVTDVLNERGDRRVMHKLAANRGARFSLKLTHRARWGVVRWHPHVGVAHVPVR